MKTGIYYMKNGGMLHEDRDILHEEWGYVT